MDSVKDLVGVAIWIGPRGAVKADDITALARGPDVCGIGT